VLEEGYSSKGRCDLNEFEISGGMVRGEREIHPINVRLLVLLVLLILIASLEMISGCRIRDDALGLSS
jgi:hypothetical protein